MDKVNEAFTLRLSMESALTELNSAQAVLTLWLDSINPNSPVQESPELVYAVITLIKGAIDELNGSINGDVK